MLCEKDDYHLVHHVLTVMHASGSYPIFIGENLLSDATIFNSYAVGMQVNRAILLYYHKASRQNQWIVLCK